MGSLSLLNNIIFPQDAKHGYTLIEHRLDFSDKKTSMSGADLERKRQSRNRYQ
jgi:hypothetical protein